MRAPATPTRSPAHRSTPVTIRVLVQLNGRQGCKSTKIPEIKMGNNVIDHGVPTKLKFINLTRALYIFLRNLYDKKCRFFSWTQR